MVALGIGGAWGSWQNLCAGDACPSIAQIRTFEHEQKSKILAHDGQQITFHECTKCHTSRVRFCNRCHEAVNLYPDCFGCHYYPE